MRQLSAKNLDRRREHDRDTGAIVGARTAAQVDGWIGAAEVRLTDADLDEVAAAITAAGAGAGPVKP